MSGCHLLDGAVGAGRALQQALGQQGTVINTLMCGDNYFSEQRAEAVAGRDSRICRRYVRMWWWQAQRLMPGDMGWLARKCAKRH